MAKKVFIDTSAWIAYSLKGEPFHEILVEYVKNLVKEGGLVVTSNDVIDETVTRLITHTNPKITKKFIEFFQESLKKKLLIQLWTDELIQAEALEVVEKFSEHRLSLTDATSVVHIKRLNIDSVITLDSDFRKIGLSVFPISFLECHNSA